MFSATYWVAVMVSKNSKCRHDTEGGAAEVDSTRWPFSSKKIEMEMQVTGPIQLAHVSWVEYLRDLFGCAARF